MRKFLQFSIMLCMMLVSVVANAARTNVSAGDSPYTLTYDKAGELLKLVKAGCTSYDATYEGQATLEGYDGFFSFNPADPDWTFMGNTCIAAYVVLPDGDYTLKVPAGVYVFDGVQNEAFEISFTVGEKQQGGGDNSGNFDGEKWQETVFKSGETSVSIPVGFDTEGVTITTEGCEFMGTTIDVAYNTYEENEIDWNKGTKLIITAKDNISGIVMQGNFLQYASADKGNYNNGSWTGALMKGETLTLTANDGIHIKELVVLYNGDEYNPEENNNNDEGKITISYPTADMKWATFNNGNKLATFTMNKQYAQVVIDVKDMEPGYDNGNYDFPTRMVDNNGEKSDNLHVGENTITAATPDAKPWNFYKGHTYKMIVRGYVNMWDQQDQYDAIAEVTFIGDGTAAPAISDITLDKVFPENGTVLPEGPRTVDLTFSAPVKTLKAIQPKGMEGSANYPCTQVDEAGLIWNVNLGSLSVVSEGGEESSISLEISGTDMKDAVLNLGSNAARALQLQYTISKNATEPEQDVDVQIVPAFLNGEEEITLNDHSSVAVEAANALKVGFGDGAAAVKLATYSIEEWVEGEDWMGPYAEWQSVSSDVLDLNTFGYAEFVEKLVFNYGSKYSISIKAWNTTDIYNEDWTIKEPIATFACEFNGSFGADVANTIEAGKYAVTANVALDQQIQEEMVPAGFKKYIGSYKTNATLAGDEEALTISENKEGGLFEGFVIKGDAVAYDPSLVIVLDGKKFNVRGTDGSESGKLAIKATEDGYTMEEAAIWYNGKQVAIVSDIKINAVEPVIAYLENADFSEGVLGDVNIATYAKDGEVHQMQEVPGWSFGVENGDAKAAGVVAYGSATTLGGATYTVPAEGPEGTNGNALAMVGVWTGTVQYVQNATLPAGKYTMVVPVYNTAGNSALVSNLIGIKYGETEKYAATKTYAVGKWTNEVIEFELEEDTEVTFSLGCVAPNVGSGAAQHLFIDAVNVEAYDELEVAKTIAIAALPVADESIFTPSASDVEAVKLAIMAAETVEEVEAVAATELSIPALQGEYMIYNTTAENYLGTQDEASVVLSAEPVAVTFEAIEGGYAIKVGDVYVNMAGTNTWSMSCASEPNTAWNFVLADGNYTIQGPNGLIGTDNTAAGSACYGNKTADKNGVWAITEYVAPAELAISFDVEEGADIDLAEVKSIHVSVALPAGVDPSDDLFIEGVLVGRDGTNDPIFGFTDFEDGVDVPVSRLTPGQGYTIFITKVAYGEVVGYDEETYMPIYENQFVAEEGSSLASLNFSIQENAVPEVADVEITVDGTTVNVKFKEGTDLGDNYAVKPYFVDAAGNTIEINDYYIDNTTGGFFDPLNLIVITLNEELADGSYTLVLPAGTFIYNGGSDNPMMTAEFSMKGGIATSISAIAATETAKEIFSANGAKLSSMQKGLNIVRLSNGTVKKIMVK